jgi:cell division transport system ATP-binding protein
MIQFQQVSKSYNNGFVALSEVSFRLEEGEMVFLTGHSGAGKSTLLKLMALLERSTGGEIIADGAPIHSLTGRALLKWRQGLGMIWQEPHLLTDRTVFANVALPLTIAGHHHQEIRQRVRIALDHVGLLNKEKSYPFMLSSGEQQRVGIARAIVHKPKLLLADEPTGNLDPALAMDIMCLFTELNREGMSVFIASHDLALIARLRYRVLSLEQGRLVQQDELSETAA